MCLEEHSREQVDGLLEDLRESYDRFERVEKTWEVDAESYEAHRAWIEQGSNGGAGVWLAREDGSVLLVRDEGGDGWADPGGKREAGETFEETGRREVREEANVECRLTDVLESHVLAIEHAEGTEEPRLWSLIVIFAGEYLSGDPDHETARSQTSSGSTRRRTWCSIPKLPAGRSRSTPEDHHKEFSRCPEHPQT